MANYLFPPPFWSDSKPPQIFWKTIETVHQKQTPEKSNKNTGRKKKVFANLHKVLKTLSSTIKCQMAEGCRIKSGIVLPELMMMWSNTL